MSLSGRRNVSENHCYKFPSLPPESWIDRDDFTLLCATIDTFCCSLSHMMTTERKLAMGTREAFILIFSALDTEIRISKKNMVRLWV